MRQSMQHKNSNPRKVGEATVSGEVVKVLDACGESALSKNCKAGGLGLDPGLLPQNRTMGGQIEVAMGRPKEGVGPQGPRKPLSTNKPEHCFEPPSSSTQAIPSPAQTDT